MKISITSVQKSLGLKIESLVLFSFSTKYTVYIILQSTVNIVFDRVGKVDPITRGIDIVVNYFGIQFDVSIWYNHF